MAALRPPRPAPTPSSSLTRSPPQPDLAAATPAALGKDLSFHWPAGLPGNPSNLPRCTLGQFFEPVEANSERSTSPQTAVGVASVDHQRTPPSSAISPTTLTAPVFNLDLPSASPPALAPALPTCQTSGDTSILQRQRRRRRPSQAKTMGSMSTPPTSPRSPASPAPRAVTVWGRARRPPRHDNSRGWGCSSPGPESARTTLPALLPKNPASRRLPYPAHLLRRPPLQCPLTAGLLARTSRGLVSVPVDPAPTSTAATDFPSSRDRRPPTPMAPPHPPGSKSALNFQDEGLTNAEGLAQRR